MPSPGAKTPTRIDLDIPSDFTSGRQAQQTILDALAAHGFTENATFAVKLALDEALINAIKHGNELRPDKRVRIRAVVDSREVVIDITDEGAGFDRSKIPDPTLDENIEKAGGRGILLIEAYMTTAEWSDQGRHLHMTRLNNDLSIGSCKHQLPKD